jgi:two-component sensor histidine kinase
MNELATNATKHGAWATEGGTVVFKSRITDGELVMEWTEMGVVGLTPPSRTGFGTRLITQAVEYD